LSGSLGYVAASRSAGASGFFNRLSDGDIVNFNKDGTTVGSIGVVSSEDLSINATDDLLLQAGGNSGIAIFQSGGTLQNVSVYANLLPSGTNDIGSSGSQWRNIYLVNAPIVSSDRAYKTDIEELNAAEISVAQSCKGLLRKFKLISDDPDTAKIHVGVIAQDLEDAFAAQGLDANDYSMFLSNTDEEGVTLRSVRYEELLAFIIAAI
jgi:hypothetical protein